MLKDIKPQICNKRQIKSTSSSGEWDDNTSEMCGEKRLVTSTEKQSDRGLGLNDNKKIKNDCNIIFNMLRGKKANLNLEF